jgi:outer membrane receptor for ferrienterochelin and colicins
MKHNVFIFLRTGTLMLMMMGFTMGKVWSQSTAAGRILDAETNEGLGSVTVVVKGTSQGTITDSEGNFSLTVSNPFPYTLSFSYVGFTTQEVVVKSTAEAENISLSLGLNTFLSDVVVVTASRRAEKITEAPATISVINSQAISQLPSFNVGELLGRQKGVDYVRSGVLGIGINVRGFSSAFNPKNLQLNDGRFSTLVATGLPFGALGTVVKEDIDRIEVVLGPSSALYGPNAHNGLVNTISKDPRTSEGTTVALGVGNQSVFSARFRHAQVISKKFAYKVSGEYTQGEEFPYTDSVYVGTTGYPELDLNLTFKSVRGEAAVYYSPNSKSDIILAYGGSLSSNIGVTNAGRNQIKDWGIHYLHLRYTSPRLFAQVYHTWSLTEDTYAMNQRTQNYRSFVAAGFSDAEARSRSYTEAWAGTSPTVGVALNRGAVFKDNSRRINAEVQYNNDFGINLFNFIVGVQYQSDLANSKGTYLLDNKKDIMINQIGGYMQLEKGFGESGFKAVLAARADNHDLYGFNFIPKAAVLYNMKKGTFRLTYGQGISAPTILNLEANIFGGLLLGNSKGFTLSDGTIIPKLQVEKIQTIEFGYKGSLTQKLYLDASAYYNLSSDFLSPSINIARPGVLVTKRGDQNLSDLQPGFATAAGSSLVLTYLNFGKVDTYGFDVGLTYYLSSKFNIAANYSYFGYSLNKGDLKNDGDKNGRVEDIDLPINTPANKANIAFNMNTGKFFGSLFVRWVESYSFFSGINVASSTNNQIIVGGTPVVENARVGRNWNYGALGNFVNVDLSFGYKINKIVTVSGQVVNVFDSKVREFVGSPSIGRLFSLELKVNLPSIK